MRFLDCAMHYPESGLNLLIKSMQRNAMHERERFFSGTIGSRRRLQQKWNEAPVAKVFLVPDEWSVLQQRAQALYVHAALKERGLPANS